MAGELVVADNQYQFRDMFIGGTSKLQWEIPPTWWGAANVRNQDTPYMASHGVRGGRDLYGSKTISGRINVLADDHADAQALLDQIGAAWAPSDEDLPFVAQQLGQKRRRYGRPRRLEVIPTYLIKGSTPIVAVEFEALDPYVYADEEQSVTVGLPGSGGFTVPFTVPFTLDAGTSGVEPAVNNGTVPAPWTARLDGPLTSPTITCGEFSLQFDVNGGLVINDGEHVIVDSKDRSVLLNGTGDRRARLNAGSTWFELQPGSNSVGLAADTGTGTMTVFWRDTYL